MGHNPGFQATCVNTFLEVADLLYLITDITHLLTWGKYVFLPKADDQSTVESFFSDTSNYQQRSSQKSEQALLNSCSAHYQCHK